MSRRGGKAASRRARRREPRRPQIPQPAPAPSPTASEAVEPRDALVERGDRPAPPAAPAVGGPSALGSRGRAEYHYVERDLRNLGILSVVITALLVAAWLAFGALGIGPA